MDLKPYICKRCGAQINVAKMRCEYCGTSYLKQLNISLDRHIIVDHLICDHFKDIQ